MKRLVIAALAAVSVTSGIASAQGLKLLEGAHEVELGNITMPGSTAGTAIFKSCAQCDPVARRVTSSTQYLIRDRALALPDFLSEVDAIRDATPANASTSVGVYYDLETGRITRIAVFFGPQ